jgi:hypothetical protein
VGDEKNLAYLLDEATRFGDRFFVNATTAQDNRSLLHLACFTGELGCVRAILRDDEVELLGRDAYDRTAFHYAAFRGWHEVLRLLIGKQVQLFRREAWEAFRMARGAGGGARLLFSDPAS